VDYPILSDLINILKLCTFRKNVFYIKEPDMESDDILASFIAHSVDHTTTDWYLYFNDNDILQVPGRYHWCKSFHEPEVDRSGYIFDKYGFSLDFLPVAYKVLRGDRSDNIPVALPRVSKRVILGMCSALEGVRDFQAFCEVLVKATWSKAFSWVPMAVATEGSDLRVSLENNWKVVNPVVRPVSEFSFKRFNIGEEEARSLLDYYQIRDYVPVS
jgi:hypothetical protein